MVLDTLNNDRSRQRPNAYWAKNFTAATDYLRSVYPHFDDFTRLGCEWIPRVSSGATSPTGYS